ncbi:hypothetical protein ASPSYDRAFT_49579 [Aspergillus sydowii CBS 593.65]|uniref:Short-chain dehydrogenase/reductase 3 n=1 Tax=Aspergillus sydowii CBS 593.65 TaxID=1036612 RepID=A0A1L9T590_9EURO|nr:uncharacterized protein ASPSYDRAFT_49579 [Aspergillus sydowii CBS 593.65]OJJ54453.1 hypothetical protein ASPSYDRAFT_49579 [Aspergillus sydowii CBS 593.65]
MRSLLQYVIQSLTAANRAVLQPVVPGSLLVALYYGPPQLRNQIVDLLARYATVAPQKLKLILSVWLALGAARVGNGALSRLAANNWHASPPVPWDWSTEIAVVTGGCGGIGRVIVEGLSKRGITVVVVDFQELPEELRDNKLIKHFSCDLTAANAVADVAKAIRLEVGNPTILINNAGIMGTHGVLETSDEYLQKIFKINLLSQWSTTREFVPHMVKRNKGHVVTIASMASFVTVGTSLDYCATKAGALAFHEGLGSELRHIYKAPGVLTTVVHPNYVRTNMTGDHTYRYVRQEGSMLGPEEVGNRVVQQVLSGRGGQVILPEHLSITTSLRAWPTWMQDSVRDLISKPVIAGLG